MPEERNYHIFYCMLCGLTATEKQKLHLTQASDYNYLTKGGCLSCEGMDDAEKFSTIGKAMKVFSMMSKWKTDCFEKNVFS